MTGFHSNFHAISPDFLARTLLPFTQPMRYSTLFEARPIERRSIHRISNPHCPPCGRAFVAGCVSRTELKVYFRCGSCGDVWSMLKPLIPDPSLHQSPANHATSDRP